MKLFPFIVMFLFLSVMAVKKTNISSINPTMSTALVLSNGQKFIDYRSAVGTYLQSNPAFTGTVTSAMLSAQGTQFTATFLADVGNYITATGVAGRIVTCYGNLPGALNQAMVITNNDASLGTASGSNWLSSVFGTSSALATAVPNQDIVSVYQVGN